MVKMDVIQAARDLGKAIQADERFIRMRKAQALNDSDMGLQDAISAFNLKRTQLNAEIQKTEKDQKTVKKLDAELKGMYSDIFANDNMREFSAAKADMEEMISHINAIVSGSASGSDPDQIDPVSACAGDCSGCAGCH